MPRIRSIKPEMWDDLAVGEVSRDARLLFCGLITQADDDGRLSADPRWLTAKIYPYDIAKIKPAEIEGWLTELHDAGLVWLYEAGGRVYIYLPGWERNQSIDKRYHRPSKLPEPPDEQPKRPRRAPAERSARPRRRSGGERSGGERSGTSAVKPADAPLSFLLAELMVDNGCKRPGVGKAWADAERLLLEKDERPREEAERLLRWSQGHEFWRSNVRSMPKFREQYDQLRLQAQRGNGAGLHPVDADIARLDAEKRRLEAEEAAA